MKSSTGAAVSAFSQPAVTRRFMLASNMTYVFDPIYLPVYCLFFYSVQARAAAKGLGV